MTEAEQNQLPAQTDAEATLVSPRFDATEAQTAQPVVPLAEVKSRQRSWPLLLISAFLGGAVSVAGLYLYQRQHAQTPPQPGQQVLTPAPAETAQVAAQPADTRTQAEDVATSAAVHTSAPPVEQPQTEKRAPLIKEPKEQDKEKAARAAAAAEERARRAEPAAVRRAASAPRGERVANERQARSSERPHAAQPRPTPQPARNVDRIRDIFEGVRPPG